MADGPSSKGALPRGRKGNCPARQTAQKPLASLVQHALYCMSESNMDDRAQTSPLAAADDLGGYLGRLGERVRTIRSRRGMTRKALARHSDVSERYLAQLEGGTGNCSVVLLRRIAQALSVPAAELIDDRPERAIESLLMLQLIDRLSPAQVAEAHEALRARFGGATEGMRRDRIALIGLRGGGKSTLGGLLAAELGFPFLELDRAVEQESGMGLSELFEMFGQPTFRRMERAALENALATNGRFVLATGGGLVTEPATFELLLASCFTVWVRASPQDHMNRVTAQGDLRPMAGHARAMDDLVAILQSREPLYAKADLTVDTSGKTPEQVLRSLTRLLGTSSRADRQAVGAR
jgi:XRE family aerobic/anaerobic benzoate catabolism transcriptional regulator